VDIYICILFVKCLLRVSAHTAPSAWRTLVTCSKLFIAMLLHWLQSISRVGFTTLFTIILCFVTNVTTLQSADSCKQVTRVLPEDVAVCVETCRRDLINNICIQLRGGF
jgi:hypothetical protein